MSVFDPEQAAAHLRSAAQSGLSGPFPTDTPVEEFRRSPAAAAVGTEAARAGLFHFHFEHRHALALPEAWVPTHGAALAARREWRGGVLPEPKYQSFRHDLAVASFHPGHRAKWGTHELCHALVGFAWRADASPLFHATAARLSELLPVVLWYFLDEAYLRRCPLHKGDGALYRTFCGACEAIASADPNCEDARWHLQDGAAFLDAELVAVARTRQLGTPIPHRYGSLDLTSDGIAYAASHGRRLDSEAMERWVDAFAVEGGGYHADLDSLEARVIDVARAITTGEPLDALVPDAASGRSRWTRQDLGARLLQVWTETDGEAAQTLLDIVRGLSDDPVLESSVSTAADAYRALHEEWELPSPEAVFATGYGLPTGLGSDVAQLSDGLASALPGTTALLGQALGQRTRAFVTSDRCSRVPLGRRFAAFISPQGPTQTTDLARYEAAVQHGRSPDVARAQVLGPNGTGAARLCAGVDVLPLTYDPEASLSAVENGITLPEAEPVGLIIGHGVDGPVAVAVDVATARQIEAGADLDTLDPAVVDALLQNGLAQRAAWTMHASEGRNDADAVDG